MHIRRPLGKRLDKKYVVATIKHPSNQMIWPVMSCCGVVHLYFIPPNTTIDGPKYLKLLKEKLKLHMYIHGCMIIMEYVTDQR